MGHRPRRVARLLSACVQRAGCSREHEGVQPRARYPRVVQLRRDAKLELLKGVPLFANCSKSDLRRIAMLADEVDFGEGRTLIREGTRGREFFVVVEGALRVTRDGKKLGDLGPGAFVGEMALVADVPRTATVTASTPVRLLVLTKRGFLDLLTQSPAIATRVLQSLGERLHSDFIDPGWDTSLEAANVRKHER